MSGCRRRSRRRRTARVAQSPAATPSDARTRYRLGTRKPQSAEHGARDEQASRPSPPTPRPHGDRRRRPDRSGRGSRAPCSSSALTAYASSRVSLARECGQQRVQPCWESYVSGSRQPSRCQVTMGKVSDGPRAVRIMTTCEMAWRRRLGWCPPLEPGSTMIRTATLALVCAKRLSCRPGCVPAGAELCLLPGRSRRERTAPSTGRGRRGGGRRPHSRRRR